jgi:hypothetical protein
VQARCTCTCEHKRGAPAHVSASACMCMLGGPPQRFIDCPQTWGAQVIQRMEGRGWAVSASVRAFACKEEGVCVCVHAWWALRRLVELRVRGCACARAHVSACVCTHRGSLASQSCQTVRLPIWDINTSHTNALSVSIVASLPLIIFPFVISNLSLISLSQPPLLLPPSFDTSDRCILLFAII